MLEVIESVDNNNLKIKIDSIVYANAIRRILIAEVPSLSVEQLEIFKNTTVLPDEVISHRLAMLPVYSENASALCPVDECLCKGLCNKCSIEFSLNVKASNRKEVTTENIKSNEDIFHVKSLINILESKQSLNLRGFVIKGTGKTHSKFTNVVVSYEYDVNNKNRDTEFWEEHDTSVNQEWFVEQSSPDLINTDEKVVLGIETQEGVYSATYALGQSVSILKSKMERLFSNAKEVFN